jgi:siroheme decarboxylase
MDASDLQLLQELEKGIPLVEKPYAEIASSLGISEGEVISRITLLRKEGVIRRIRARINQRSIGICANALVAWKISEAETDTAGEILSELPQVTHCYQRRPVQGIWEYSIYTVHHGWTRRQVTKEVAQISAMMGYSDYMMLFSTEEYKRVPHTRAQDLEADT